MSEIKKRRWLARAAIAFIAAFANGAAFPQCVNIDDAAPSQAAQVRPSAPGAPVTPQSNPNARQASDTSGASKSQIKVSSGQLQMLVRVKAKLRAIARIDPLVVVCANQTINAVAISEGPGIPQNGMIQITTGIMEIIGNDESKAASMLAHEMAHLVEAHTAQQREFNRGAVPEAIRIGVQEEIKRPGAGILAARQAFITASRAYSRDLERLADDLGYQIYRKAGFDPREASRLMESVRSVSGDRTTNYLDTHPGLDTRIARTLAIARDDSVRAAASEAAKAVERDSLRYQGIADELFRNGRWREASLLVSQWIAAVPASGLGWYYRGQLMRRSDKEKGLAWEAFARGVELDPERAAIWDALVESLLVGGYRGEAVACLATMSQIGLSIRGLREKLFNDKVFVDAAQPSPANLWWAREPSGSRFITNDPTLLEIRSMQAQEIPPMWKPVK